MKYIFLLAMFLPGMVSGQTKVDGIGILKIGAHDRQIIPKFEEMYGHVRVATQFNDLRRPKDKHVYLLIPERRNEFLAYDIYPCASTHYYMLRRYEIGDVLLTNIVIGFYDSILFSIHSMDNIKYFKEGITAKFGKPHEVVLKDTITCTYTYTGASFDKITYSFFSTFRDDDIYCQMMIGDNYNEKCEKDIVSAFDLRNKRFYSMAYRCSHEDVEKTKDLENENKKQSDKEKYRDF